ncbi:hypothetical protein KUTeg_003796 [Tegillarca granosa]|uniref:RING-type E3 ubiquitin transferase n=1 Tax=Tegillarca granosa TaxID=220873 RepID=A0ABQ9FSL5_TEGGR|nr:hypothetical protein KUTeg_003796 [Tegillarca granosa]
MYATQEVTVISMAEGGVTPKNTPIPTFSKKIQCRYFLHGCCRAGSNCAYAHNYEAPPSNVCRFYQKGLCSYGDRCRYDHVKPNTITPVTKSSAVKNAGKPSPILSIGTESKSRMVSLKKKAGEGDTAVPVSPKSPDEWVKAVEFVPGRPYVCATIPASYAKAAGVGDGESLLIEEVAVKDCSKLLCPYLPQGECPYEENCEYIHGDLCEICSLPECTDQVEKDMELSFAVSRSKDKACGICMEVIMEKNPSSERRFGVLSDCSHVFCLTCIRKWRSAKQFENKIVRACPECRVKSDFVTPSQFWVDSKEEKQKLIDGYKDALRGKACKYFDEGKGECPFNEKCFYRHAYPDGTIADPKPRQRRRRQNAEGELDGVDRINLWDFLEERQNRLLLLELDNLIFNLLFADSDSDSDYDDTW